MKQQHKGRPRKGTLYETRSGWRARVTTEVDGERIRTTVDLQTKHKAVAEVKLRRLIREGVAAKEPSSTETFAEAAERIVEEADMACKDNRLGRLRNHVFEHIGGKPVVEVTASDLNEVMKAMVKGGYSKGLCTLVRNDVSAVLGELWREEVLTENVAKRVKVPRAAVVDTRERAVLTDDELAIYLKWEHPQSRHASSVLERQTMGCISRMFGGVRIGDIRAMRWEAFEVDGGAFAVGWAKRKKTKRAQRLAVPEVLRPVLRRWWIEQGRPTTGPMFTNRKGPTAGKEKGRSNIAEALRRDLMRAFGIEVRVGEKSKGRWVKAREMTPRERELFEPTEFTKPVEFHSFRRGFKQGMADAGVELSLQMALSGSTDVKAHIRYLNNTLKKRGVPEAALPALGKRRAVDGGTAEAASAEVAHAATPNVAAAPSDAAQPVPPSTDVPSAPQGSDPVLPPPAAAADDTPAQPPTFAMGHDRSRVAKCRKGRGRSWVRTSDFNRVKETRHVVRRHKRRKTTDGDPAGALPETAPNGHDAKTPCQKSGPSEAAPPPTGEPAPQSALESLRAAAHAAVEAGNWSLLRQLEPLIDAETKRESGAKPVSLEAVRTKREGSR